MLSLSIMIIIFLLIGISFLIWSYKVPRNNIMILKIVLCLIVGLAIFILIYFGYQEFQMKMKIPIIHKTLQP